MRSVMRGHQNQSLILLGGWYSHQRTNGGVLFTNHLKVQLMLRAKRSNCYQWINVIFCCYGLLSSFGVNKQVKRWLLFLPFCSVTAWYLLLANGCCALSLIPSDSFIGLKVTQLKGQNPRLKADSSPHRFPCWRCLIMSYLWTIQIRTEVGDVCSNEISVVLQLGVFALSSTQHLHCYGYDEDVSVTTYNPKAETSKWATL